MTPKDEMSAFQLRIKAERRLELGQVHISALHLGGAKDHYVDPMCYDLFEDGESGNIYRLMLSTPLDKMNEAMLTLHDVEEVFDDNTREFEMFPGEIVPLDGVFCSHCGAQLMEPYEPDLDDEDVIPTEDGWSVNPKAWGED